MIIKSATKEYTVSFESNLDFLKPLMNLKNTEYVIDRTVYDLYQDYFMTIPDERLFLMDAIEENKTIQTALDICERMTDISAKRNATLVSIGGGIVQDITGFAANILYRGIRWIYVPTTLLSQCDSCIGGKTSLNYLSYKNLLGTFYPPTEIHICTDFVRTLSERDFESGLGEVVKFNLMRGQVGLDNLQQKFNELLRRDRDVVNDFVHNSLEFKKDFIEQDEFDRGERIKLNFAHTFGHAIETITDYQIPHGTAVAIGMIMADHVSEKRNLLTSISARYAERMLIKIIHINEQLLDVSVEKLINAIRKDKKQINNGLTIVLMENSPLDFKIINNITEEEIVDAFNFFKQLYRRDK